MRSLGLKRPLTLETLSLKHQLLQAQTTETPDDSDRAPSFDCMLGDRGFSETTSFAFSGDTPPSFSELARGNASHTDESLSTTDWNFPEVNFEDAISVAPSFGDINSEYDFGGFFHLEDVRLPEVLTYPGLFNIYEDIPRLDELEEAFDVCDENKDGLIDAWELQRALFSLEMMEIADIEDCKKMIRMFDNTDGMIDFNEFVKLLETTWS